MNGTVGRSSSFEVVVGGYIAHSKLKTGGFPRDYGALATEIKAFFESGTVPATWVKA